MFGEQTFDKVSKRGSSDEIASGADAENEAVNEAVPAVKRMKSKFFLV